MVDFYGNREAAGRLPVSLDIQPGESVSGWLQALAVLYGFKNNYQKFLRYPPIALPEKVFDVDRGMPSNLVAHLERATLLEPGTVKQHFAKTEYLLTPGKRHAVCPICLARDLKAGRRPYRRLSWARPTTLQCFEHSYPLLDLIEFPQTHKEWRKVLGPHIQAAERFSGMRSPILSLCGEVDKYLSEQQSESSLRHRISKLNRSALWQSRVCRAPNKRRKTLACRYIEMFRSCDPLGFRLLFEKSLVGHRDPKLDQSASGLCRVASAGFRRQLVFGAVIFGQIRFEGLDFLQSSSSWLGLVYLENNSDSVAAPITPDLRAAAETVMRSDFFGAVQHP